MAHRPGEAWRIDDGGRAVLGGVGRRASAKIKPALGVGIDHLDASCRSFR